MSLIEPRLAEIGDYLLDRCDWRGDAVAWRGDSDEAAMLVTVALIGAPVPTGASPFTDGVERLRLAVKMKHEPDYARALIERILKVAVLATEVGQSALRNAPARGHA